MPWFSDLVTAHILTFALVLARAGGFVATALLFSAAAVPITIRAIIAFALALVVAPLQAATPFESTATLVELPLALIMETLVGLALGMGTAILLAGAQLAGQLIAQLSGLSLAEVYDPLLETNVPVVGQLLHLFVVATYLALGGHRWLIAGLLDTFAALPPGGPVAISTLPDALITLMTESFSLGIRAAAPVVIALLLATLILGLTSRSLPQLNVLAVGFGLNTFVAFGALALSLGTIAWLFEEQFRPAMTIVRAALELPMLTDN